MKSRLFILLAGVLLLAARSASAQSRDPYFTTFSANYDAIYHETGATSHAGAHFDVASTFKRDVPFIGPVGEVGFNHFDGGTVASVMGPEAYISPDWYGVDDQVPTWNYLAVEAEGPLRRLDEAELAELLDGLSAAHEARLAPKPVWTRAKMTPGRFDAMLKAIIGYELRIEDLRGTRKLGQNKGEATRRAAAAGLAPFNPAMAALMDQEERA